MKITPMASEFVGILASVVKTSRGYMTYMIYVMSPRDVLTTEARMPTNSEAIGVIIIS